MEKCSPPRSGSVPLNHKIALHHEHQIETFSPRRSSPNLSIDDRDDGWRPQEDDEDFMFSHTPTRSRDETLLNNNASLTIQGRPTQSPSLRMNHDELAVNGQEEQHGNDPVSSNRNTPSTPKAASGATVRDISSSVKGLSKIQEILNKALADMKRQEAQGLAQASNVNAPIITLLVQQAINDGERSAKRKKRSNAENKASDQPEIDKEFAEHLRESDANLIEYGKLLNGYERHVRAPYAFTWSGRLRAAYDRLMSGRGDEGERAWSDKEIA